ncbi:hypothetical protein ATANTOWER_013619, partial [Ataeniobius toweri]|nr:hypothetical protein [Ataeniobius toweri]
VTYSSVLVTRTTFRSSRLLGAKVVEDTSLVGHGEAGAYLQQSLGGRRGRTWTGRQSIAGQQIKMGPHPDLPICLNIN